MARDVIKDTKGLYWEVDWDGFNNLIVAYAYMIAFTQQAKLKSQSIDFAPKAIRYVDFDPKAMQATRQGKINELVPMLLKLMRQDGLQAFGKMAMMRNAIMTMRDQRADLFATAAQSGKSFDAWCTGLLTAAQFTRDAAIGSLAIVAMPAGGTMALGAVLVSSGGAAAAKYQDTGNARSAAFAGFQQLVMCGVGAASKLAEVGNNLTPAAQRIMIASGIVMDSTFEAANAAMDGKTGADALKAVMIKAVAGLIGAKIDAAPLVKSIDDAIESICKKAAQVSVSTATKAGSKTLVEGGKKGAEYAVGAAVDAATSNGNMSIRTSAPSAAEMWVRQNAFRPSMASRPNAPAGVLPRRG